MLRERAAGADVRHAVERRILQKHEVHSQAELAEHMLAAGQVATQATISRDLAALGVFKIHADDGRAIYVLPDDDRISGRRPSRGEGSLDTELEHLGHELIIDVFRSGNMLTLRCPAGAANYVAASIDQVSCDQVKGTIAGDDTILVIASDEAAARRIERSIA